VVAVSLTLGVGSASAKTVYDYVYSGTYFDGSTAGKQFDQNIAGIVYDKVNNQFLVANGGSGGEPGWVSKFNASTFGPVNFSAFGSPLRFMEPGGSGSIGGAQIDVDQTGGANSGNFYIGTGTHFAFEPDGTEIAAFRASQENGCGIAVDPNGEEIIVPGRNGMYWFTLDGNAVEKEFGSRKEDHYRVGSPGYEPGRKAQWAERAKACKPVVDGNGDIVGVKAGAEGFDNRNNIVKITDEGIEVFQLTRSQEYVAAAIDSSNDDIFVIRTVGGGDATFELYDSAGRSLGAGFGAPDPGPPYSGLTGTPLGIAVDPVTHDVWVANRREYGGGVRRVEKFVRTNPHIIPDTTAVEPIYDHPTGESVTLKGILNPDGVETTDCYFEWGLTQSLGEVSPCFQGNNFSGSEDQVVTAKISTSKGVRYFYKLFAKNGNGQLAASNTEYFFPQNKPVVPVVSVSRVSTDNVQFRTEFDPNGGNASYHFEWGHNGNFEFSDAESDTFGFSTFENLFSGENLYEPGVRQVANLVTGLEPGTTYEYRAAVTNEAGTTYSPVEEFTTYEQDPGTDPCPNAQVRQQVEASLVPDCRAYELVSARNAGGYDVVSDIVPGQTPLKAFPRADDSLLYSIHFGLIPGMAGSPTNLGLDPYVATRDDQTGWSTRYVGLPADGMADTGAFGSPLFGADSTLRTFAFGGPEICDPCFADDNSINVPLRLPDNSLIKGMAGSSNPAADPVGEVRKPLSGDGTHFVFGSDQVFESDASSGSQWIYDRDLSAGTTQLVSTMPNGDPISGEVAQLDISEDGNRVLVGKVVGEDGAGNRFYDLYMHVGGNPESVLVADTPSGVIYNGMTSDGAKVFFTTADVLAGDGDTSADLFRADVGNLAATVSRVSTGSGGTGNSDACTPITDWNVVSGGPDCSTVAFAGGTGVATGDGTVYFVSPEKLDGAANGTDDQPNLYVVEPGGSPEFVALLDSSLIKPGPQPPNHPVTDNAFISGLSAPEGMTIDQSNGDVYVIERTGARLARYDSTGAPKNFTAGPNAGSNKLTGLVLGLTGRAGVAVDNAPGSPLAGDIYVKGGAGNIRVYEPSGELIGLLTGFGDACGVAVDQSSGVVYVGDRTFSVIWRLQPTSGSTPVTTANYTITGLQPGFQPCAVAADSLGNVYAGQQTLGPIRHFEASDFSELFPAVEGTEIDPAGRAMMVDPETNDLYVNEGDRIARFDSTGALIQKFGNGNLGTNSRGVAVNAGNGQVYAPSGESIVEFGVEPVPYIPIDQPGIRHGVLQSEVHSFEDFQVSPDGRYAAFSSVVPLTGKKNLGFSQLFRYDATADSLACVTCAATGALPESHVRLSATGLNMTDDGDVFFTTLDSLALRDTNGKLDAYQWSAVDGTGLISTGIGQDDSGLLSVSADGTNAFFYTRDILVPEDENSNTVKVYVARAGGGFLHDPPRLPCAASDECHGPGTQAPTPPRISTVTGSERKARPPKSTGKRCKKGKVKRRGKCVKKKKRAKRRRATRRHG
jgi:hypothetical protein